MARIRKGQRRMKYWDYRTPGYYFITIRVKGDWWFGAVNQNRMMYSDLGRYAKRCWEQIPLHFPQVQVDTFILMPNHMHGILQMEDHVRSPIACYGAPKKEFHQFSRVVPQSLSSIISHTNQPLPSGHMNMITTIFDGRHHSMKEYFVQNNQL